MPIRVTVLYFGQTRDESGTAKETFSLPPGSSVRSVVERVTDRHPGVRRVIRSVQVAVNEALAALDDRLEDGDVVALLPPVAGG